MNQNIIDQVDVEAICKKHNIGRYDLIRVSTHVAREMSLTPHNALKKILEVDDLNQIEDMIQARKFSMEFKKF